MAIPLLTFHTPSTPGRGPGGTSRVFFWTRSDRPHPSSPPVLSISGNNINTWYDQSYYDHHVTSTGTARPVRLVSANTCGLQVLDTVDFDGVNDKAQSVAFPETFLNFVNSKEVAVHLTFRAGNNTNATLFSIHDTGTNRDGITISIIPGGIVCRITLGLNCGEDGYIPTTFTLPAGLAYNDGQVHSISFMFNQNLLTNQLTLTVDGIQVAVTLDTNGIFAGSKIITLGQYDDGGQFPYDGEILETIAQFKASEVERLIIYDYFQRKWCSN